jgi:hypothetical protein
MTRLTSDNNEVKEFEAQAEHEFVVNDLSIATFLEGHGSRMIDCRDGKYVFIYDDTIDKNLELYAEVWDKCMF